MKHRCMYAYTYIGCAHALLRYDPLVNTLVCVPHRFSIKRDAQKPRARAAGLFVLKGVQ